jgi:hypothetical protein
MSAWLFKTTEIGQQYKRLSALLLQHKQGKIDLSSERLKSLKGRRSQYALFLRMLKTSAKHQPLMIFYEDQRLIALAKYGNKKSAASTATKLTVEQFKPPLSSSQIRAIIKAYR